MIKLAIISDDPGRGGAYKVAADIANGLDKSIYDIQWFFLCQKPEGGSPGIYLGTPPININYSLLSYIRLAFFPKRYERSYKPLNEALKTFLPDIIHFHTHAILLTLVHGIQVQKLNAQLLYTDHSQRLRLGELSFLKEYLMTRVYRRLFRHVKVVFVSGYAYHTALQLKYGIKDKDFLISNSVDIQKFCPEGANSEAIRVVYLARLHHAKGHHLLLDAWQQLPKVDNLSLHLYGSEADGGGIRKRMDQERFQNSVFYEGVTSLPESILQNAQIGVIPSYREGLPLALLEMMACGLPVVASDIPEIKSIITDGKDGLLFKCGDAYELAYKLQQLINNEQLKIQLGKEARKTIEKYYSEPIADTYSELYQSLGKHNY